jgi:DnaJ-class molecular chaperone
MSEDRKHSETKVVVCYNCKGEGFYYSQHLTDYHRGEYDTKQHTCHICEGSGLLSESVVVKYEPYTQPKKWVKDE